MSKLNDLTAITTPSLSDLVYCVQNSTDYKVTNQQLLDLIKTNTVIPLTQTQYDNLTPAEKNNGSIYIITDASITAADVEYTRGVSVADAINGVIAKTDVDKSFNAVANGFSDTGSRILVFVPFPFLMADTNYNVDCNYVNLVGQGVYTTGITVDSKYESGCMLIVTATATAGRAYGGRAYLRVYTS